MWETEGINEWGVQGALGTWMGASGDMPEGRAVPSHRTGLCYLWG